MDVNADGRIDILSGSYSRAGQDMAGLFWVLPGLEGGGFRKAEQLLGTDGEPLIIASGENVVGKICTRPFAVDFDGDGDLDIVSGNFEGTFWLFEGEGEGRFAPASTKLMLGDDKALRVTAHSDPFFVDWDGDGDRDLVAGATDGVSLFVNRGEGKFAKPELLVEYGAESPYGSEEMIFGEDHITAPQGSLRVWVSDLNGDGRLDLLLGDNAYINNPADGLDEETARARLAEWETEKTALDQRMNDEGYDAVAEEFDALYEKRSKIVESGGVGFVWVLYQQPPTGA